MAREPVELKTIAPLLTGGIGLDNLLRKAVELTRCVNTTQLRMIAMIKKNYNYMNINVLSDLISTPLQAA